MSNRPMRRFVRLALLTQAGAFFAGCAYVCVRKLGATEHPLVIVLYFPLVALLAAPVTVPFMAEAAVWPIGSEWLWPASSPPDRMGPRLDPRRRAARKRHG